MLQVCLRDMLRDVTQNECPHLGIFDSVNFLYIYAMCQLRQWQTYVDAPSTVGISERRVASFCSIIIRSTLAYIECLVQNFECRRLISTLD